MLSKHMIDWEAVKGEFALDGSWRDIYVLNATIDDWVAIWSMLRNSRGAEFFVDGQRHDIPHRVEDAFALRASAAPKMHVDVGRTLLAFHFFSESEIECDLDPRQVTNQADLDALLNFVREVGDRTGKRTIITPENLSDEPFIEYNPITKMMTRSSKPL
jgi:hypothetical protein